MLLEAAYVAEATWSKHSASAPGQFSSEERMHTDCAAAGGDGVARAIEILRADIIRTLRLLGCHEVGSARLILR